MIESFFQKVWSSHPSSCQHVQKIGHIFVEQSNLDERLWLKSYSMKCQLSCCTKPAKGGWGKEMTDTSD